jgi:hypothetical protein
MVTEIELFDAPDLTTLDFCLWGWMKSEVYKGKFLTHPVCDNVKLSSLYCKISKEV